jgi:hypothetical protein
MKIAEAVLVVKFISYHPPRKLALKLLEHVNSFRIVPGLIQHYYLTEELTSDICGFYVFETKSARAAFWGSKLAKKILAQYGIVPGTIRMEQYEIVLVLNYVLADARLQS